MRKNIIRVMILVMMLVMVSVQAFAYVYYNQKDYYDYSYTSIGDSKQTIGSSGCGPTSLAMVIANLGSEKVSPVTVANTCVSKGWRTANNGTAHAAFESSYWNIYDVVYVGNYGWSQSNAEAHVKNGGMFVVGTPGHLLAAGYSGNDNKPFKILDPWGGEYNGNYSYSQLKSSSFSRRGAVGSLWAWSSTCGNKFDPGGVDYSPTAPEYSIPEVTANFEMLINGEKVQGVNGCSNGTKFGIGVDEIKTIKLSATEENKDYVIQWIIYRADGTPEYLGTDSEKTINFGAEGYAKYVNPANHLITIEQKVGGSKPNSKIIVLEAENIPLVHNFEVYVNGIETKAYNYENGTVLPLGVDKVETIKLEDKSNIKNWGLSWVIYRADGTPEYLGGGTPVINFGEEGYAKYVNPENNLITIEQIVGIKEVSKKQIALKIEKIPVEPNFEVYVNEIETKAYNYENGTVLPLGVDKVETIKLEDKANSKALGLSWIIYKADGTPEYLGGESIVTIPFGEEGYAKYINPENNLITIEQIIGISATKKKQIILKAKEETTDIPSNIQDGMKVKVTTGKTEREYTIEENNENVIWVRENSKIEILEQNITEYRIWDQIKNEKVVLPSGKIDNINKYINTMVKEDANTYILRAGITRANGDSEGYTIKIKVSDEIGMILSGKEYEATKENPIYTGAIFSGIVLENRTDKNIARWEIMNEKTGKYELCVGTNNKQEIYTTIEHYKEVGTNKYKLTIRAEYEDGKKDVKEIYLKILQITNIANNDIVSANKDLKIKWSGEAGKEYYIRMVKLSEAGDEYNTEIEPGKILTGSEYVVPAQKLEKNCKYRIALKESNAQYY
ncbi:MAG: hypothetical protein E7311_06110, partial [Clostridiales bacterium]|nr:hypothetical protein [Clostridiales bacterium]